jgi:hypothetical protein
LRITAVRFPAYLCDKSPPEFEYCTVARRWLRVAFLLPGAAALAAFVVELAVSGNLVAKAAARCKRRNNGVRRLELRIARQ